MARNKYPEVTVNRILDVSAKLFLEKGYEHTTIQDILNELGDLSKGAIYHHFKSKDEIIEAVCERYYTHSNAKIFSLPAQEGMTGLEKLRMAMKISLDNPSQKKMLNDFPNLLKNPRFLALQVYESVEEVAPQLIEPMLRQGMEDGSIRISNDNIRETAQLMMLMANIWLNPAVFKMTPEELIGRFRCCALVLESLGISNLMDEDILESLQQYQTLTDLPHGTST